MLLLVVHMSTLALATQQPRPHSLLPLVDEEAIDLLPAPMKPGQHLWTVEAPTRYDVIATNMSRLPLRLQVGADEQPFREVLSFSGEAFEAGPLEFRVEYAEADRRHLEADLERRAAILQVQVLDALHDRARWGCTRVGDIGPFLDRVLDDEDDDRDWSLLYTDAEYADDLRKRVIDHRDTITLADALIAPVCRAVSSGVKLDTMDVVAALPKDVRALHTDEEWAARVDELTERFIGGQRTTSAVELAMAIVGVETGPSVPLAIGNAAFRDSLLSEARTRQALRERVLQALRFSQEVGLGAAGPWAADLAPRPVSRGTGSSIYLRYVGARFGYAPLGLYWMDEAPPYVDFSLGAVGRVGIGPDWRWTERSGTSRLQASLFVDAALAGLETGEAAVVYRSAADLSLRTTFSEFLVLDLGVRQQVWQNERADGTMGLPEGLRIGAPGTLGGVARIGFGFPYLLMDDNGRGYVIDAMGTLASLEIAIYPSNPYLSLGGGRLVTLALVGDTGF